MARLLNRLTAREVATLSEPGRHADGGRLYLSISTHGRKSWTFMWVKDGRQREMGLGAVSDVSLAKARQFAQAAREQLAEGRDPLEARRALQAIPTFAEVAAQVLKDATARSRNAVHAAQWKRSLEVEAEALRALRVDKIGTEDIVSLLRPIWDAKPETASRLRGRIERVLDAAAARGWRSRENPARWKGHLASILPAQRKLVRGHHTAMKLDDVPVFMASLRERPAVAARALEFLIQTASRTGEVIGATWSEIDLDQKIWTVPADRMKAGREHRVPLTARAMEILRERLTAQPDAKPGDYVFPGPKEASAMSNMAMTALLKRMDVDVTTHGFRSAFRDFAGDRTSFAREVAEAALAHRVGDATEQAYRRSDALEKRRKLMESWAGFLASPRTVGDVVAIGSVRRAKASPKSV
jgi:integrase